MKLKYFLHIIFIIITLSYFGCQEESQLKKVNNANTIDSVGLPLGVDLEGFYDFPDKWEIVHYAVAIDYELDTIKDIHQLKWNELGFKYHQINRYFDGRNVAIVDFDSIEMNNYSHNKVEYAKFKLPNIKSYEVYFIFYANDVGMIGNLLFLDKNKVIKKVINIYSINNHDDIEFNNTIYFIDENYNIYLSEFFCGLEQCKKIRKWNFSIKEMLD
jgi:hypothetical protein